MDGVGGRIIKVRMHMPDRAILLLDGNLPLILERNGIQPEPVHDALFLQRLHIDPGQGSYSGITLAATDRQIAVIIGLAVESLSRNISLGMEDQKVDPESGEVSVRPDQLVDDRLDDARFSGGMLDPIGELRRLSFSLLDDAAAKRIVDLHFNRFFLTLCDSTVTYGLSSVLARLCHTWLASVFLGD